MRLDLCTHLDLVSSHMGLERQTSDHKEGVQAFKDKRPPKSTGRQEPRPEAVGGYSASAIALPRSAVLALPPISGVRGASEPGSSAVSIARTMAAPAAGSPRK